MTSQLLEKQISHSHLWQYEDEDKDRIILASDNDLVAAVHHARLLGWKVAPRHELINCSTSMLF